MSSRLVHAAWVAVLTVSVVGLLCGQSYAATIAVDSTVDVLAIDGSCTLREAVVAANTNSAVDTCAAGDVMPTVDVIDLPAGLYQMAIAPVLPDDAEHGDLDLVEDVIVQGQGKELSIIDGGGLDRIFEVQSGVTAVVNDVAIQHGAATGGGGVSHSGVRLTLNRCRIASNFNDGSTGSAGGGIRNLPGAQVELYDSEVVGNISDGASGGISNQGFAVVERSTISGNQATTGAGGVAVDGALTLRNSTISGNSAGTHGGGVHVGPNATVSIDSSTITGNTAGSGYGGGIFNYPQALVYSRHSIIAENLAGGECYLPITSNGGNVEGPGSSCGFVAADDLTAVSPEDLGLAPLYDMGGPTQTHALYVASVAVDRTAGACSQVVVDQRSMPRSDGRCDSGAFEVQVGEQLLLVGPFESGDLSGWSGIVP